MPDHSHYKDYTDLRGDGRIVLYKRRDHDNPNWTVRIKISGATGYVVRSTKTARDDEARRFGEDLYYELEGRVRRGETLKSPPFKRVFEEWQKELPFMMKDLSPDYIEGNIRMIVNHALPFLANDAIDKIRPCCFRLGRQEYSGDNTHSHIGFEISFCEIIRSTYR